MRTLKTLLVTALSLAAVGVVAPKASVAASADTRDFLCEYSARKKDNEYMTFGSSDIKTYTAEEAEAAGIPDGYENEVFEIIQQSGGTNAGVFLDFEQEQLPISLIESLNFRIYIVPHANNTGSRPQARITDPTDVGNTWIHQPDSTPTPAGEWTTVEVAYNDKFDRISKNGMLDKFEFGVRMNAFSPVYVDSIQYVLKANDGVAPEISGADMVAVALGEPLPFEATAFDAQENRNVSVDYVWGEDVALNENGTPNAIGRYTLTLKAKDYFGNLATKTVMVNVIEEDRVAPVIDLAFDTVKTTVGTKPMLDVTATDDSGQVTLTKTWSAGALDGRGRLTQGTHTWTLTAKDLFGNTTQKTVTFIVTEEEPSYSFVTNEENLAPKRSVTFDGKNEVLVTDGFIMDKPADPIKESTAEGIFTFIGWYYGEAEWNFDNPITQDMDLQSKWDVQKRLYRIYIDGELLALKLGYGDLIPADAIPAEPKKEMDERYTYVFAGWYNGEELWNFETSVVTGETQLVARFEKVDRIYTVTFDGQNTQQVKYGEKLVEPAAPEKAGYTFEGWYSGIVKWNFEKNVVRSDMSLTAKWKSIGGEPPVDEDSTQPPVGDSTQDSGDSASTDEDTSDGADSSGGSNGGSLLSGCGASIGGVTCGLAAFGAAFVLLKKKED